MFHDLIDIENFIPPDAEACGCGYDHSEDWSVFGMKLESPSLFELDLSRRNHRWREVNRIMRSFFKAFADEVTRAEEKILEAAGLPSLEEVRSEAEKIPHIGSYGDLLSDWLMVKQVDPELLDRIDEIFNLWVENLIGSGVLPDRLDDLPAYHYHTLNAFATGLQKTLEQIEEHRDDAVLAPLDYGNPYLAKFTQEGMARIKTKLAQQYRPLVEQILRAGIERGDNPLAIAREIHRRVGEGQLWYWQRLARSETAIALDAAFQSEASVNGVQYEKWSTSANPCPICAPLDGKIWRLGEGPRVVYDTHPHCLCVKYAFFEEPSVVQPAATQSVPYL